MVVTYQNRLFSWTINKMGSEVEKIVTVHFWTINDTFKQYVKCECFFELLVVTVLTVSHLVAFIWVLYQLKQRISKQIHPCYFIIQLWSKISKMDHHIQTFKICLVLILITYLLLASTRKMLPFQNIAIPWILSILHQIRPAAAK